MATNKKEAILKRITDSIEKVATAKESSKYYNFSEQSGDLKTLEDRGIQACILNNFQKIYDSSECAALMKTPNYGPYVPEIWPVVTAWYPEFPLKDLISVQGMDQPLTYMFFSTLRAGTAKAPTQFGEVVETPLGLRELHGSYPTGEVHGEQLKNTDFEILNGAYVTGLAYYPLTIAAGYSEKFLINIEAPTAVAGKYVFDYATDNVINFKAITGNATVTLDMSTGALTVKPETALAEGATVPTDLAASVNYVWDIENSDFCNIPSITEDIIMLPMEARPRALGMKWTVFSEFVKKAQFGTDIRTDTTKRVLALLFQYQCRYILDTMYEYSTEAEQTVTIPTANITVESKVQNFLADLNKVATTISKNSGRMAGNRLVVGMDMKAWLESLPNTYWKPSTQEDQGYEAPRYLGKIGNFEVFYDPQRASNTGFMTYKSDAQWADAAYYLGEFIPVTPTDAITLGVQVRSAFVSMEAHCYHKPSCVIPLKFSIV